MKLSPGPLLQSLIKTILLPLLCGAATRAAIPGERGWGKSAMHLDIVQGVAHCRMRLVSACWPQCFILCRGGKAHLLDALVTCD